MSLTLYAFQRSGLELDTEQQPQGGSPYGSSYDSVNGSPRVVPSHDGMPPLDLPHTSSLSRKARVAPTSGGSSQPDSPNLARFSCPWARAQQRKRPVLEAKVVGVFLD